MTPFYTEIFEGFTINVYALPEDTDPADCFDDCCADDIAAIRDGRCEWFIAMVTASVDGVELGCAYLGGCAYYSLRDFISPDGYFEDLRAEAIAGAQETLGRITATLA